MKFSLVHRDAAHGTPSREEALSRLREGTASEPFGVTNVGIFGEGIDTPELDAVAFIESRKSPVDVIQAVGRIMRRSPRKSMGYIIVPLAIPPGQNAEAWLESSAGDGFDELGEVLRALRAHDERIETGLEQRLHIYTKSEPELANHIVVVRYENETETMVWNGPSGGLEHELSKRADSVSVAEHLADYGTVTALDEVPYLQEPACAVYIVDDRTPGDPRLAPVDVSSEWQHVSRAGYPTAPPAKKAQAILRETLQGRGKKNRTRLRRIDPKKNDREKIIHVRSH